jgi:endonuclease VIII
VPEGHTVHRSARDLAELAGAPVRASSPQGRFAEGAAAVDGSVLERAEAHGKHLFVRTGGGTVHVHLGMRGIWLRYADPDRPGSAPMKQVRLRLASERVAWDLVAPTTCELFDDAGVAAVRAGLGPDPLREDADAAAVDAALAADRRAIGAVLLDQAVVSGVGNVFRAEALHAVGVHPARPARDLSADERERLWSVLRSMMEQAVDDGRIVTVTGPDRLAVPEDEARKVYQQATCRDCGAEVEVGRVGGRTSYRCVVEQAR